MDTTLFPRLADLFRQLGLPDEPSAIERFIVEHRPLAAGMILCDAPFWSASQAMFLREQIHADAHWSEVVDLLAVQLEG